MVLFLGIIPSKKILCVRDIKFMKKMERFHDEGGGDAWLDIPCLVTS
jgi:hypothetical protein